MQTQALLDGGSNATLIEQDLARERGLSGPQSKLVLGGADMDDVVDSFKLKDLSISAVGRKRTKYIIPKVHTIPRMNYRTYSVDWTKENLRFDHLKDLPLRAVNASDIKLVVGIDAYILQASTERRLGSLGTPIAVTTRLGWVAFSHLPGSEEEKIHVCRMDAEL